MGTGHVFQELRRFVTERDWSQFHSESNLAKSISIEAAELLECFQWDDNFDRNKVISELADVLTYGYLLAEKLQVVPHQIILEKLKVTERKYPAERSYGRSTKYDQLSD